MNRTWAERRGSARARRFVRRLSLFLAGVLVALGACSETARTADFGQGTGEIGGQLYAADHPESLAAGADVALIFRGSDGTRHELNAESDSRGAYRFTGLPTATEVSYVLRVAFRGNSFLGAPMNFAGEPRIVSNFLVSSEAPPATPNDDPAMAGESLPPGHPEVPHSPVEGKPVPLNPAATLLLVLVSIALFALPWRLAHRERPASVPGIARVAIDALVRDIASLDLRHEAEEIEREDYLRVRASLMKRLRDRTRSGEAAATREVSA